MPIAKGEAAVGGGFGVSSGGSHEGCAIFIYIFEKYGYFFDFRCVGGRLWRAPPITQSYADEQVSPGALFTGIKRTAPGGAVLLQQWRCRNRPGVAVRLLGVSRMINIFS
jgi:hypothetical protein